MKKRHTALIVLSIPLFFIGFIIGEILGVLLGVNLLINLPVFFQHLYFNFLLWLIAGVLIFVPLENKFIWTKIYVDRTLSEISPIAIGMIVGGALGAAEMKFNLLQALLII